MFLYYVCILMNTPSYYMVSTDKGYVEYARFCGERCEAMAFSDNPAKFDHSRAQAVFRSAQEAGLHPVVEQHPIKGCEGRNTQARLIRSARRRGYKVVKLFGGDHIPAGYNYLCGRFYTNQPKGQA